MGKTFAGIDEKLGRFLADQPVFFVATAPSGPDGHVNLSPKGMAGTFRILDPLTVAYLDITGSGIETVAHLRDNGRIVIMFCAFSGAPRIVRLHGRGQVVLPGDSEWEELAGRFPPQPGTRSIIRVALERVSDSCGFAVPLMTYAAERDELTKWAARKTEDELADYRAKKNATSIDGLPGMAE
ncbi:MAG TPA: pyridoxamine 5'-phosphate oxidase family protein [Acidimicrobiia bacterium]|nr:pyridoxamine 5'-phosphate oxidase family protein [Acidimicrobiia bacterium]